MGILNLLTTQGSTLSNLNGGPGPNVESDLRDSKLHYKYSLNGEPPINSQPGQGFFSIPAPSRLDMNGQIPPYNYRDNSPEGTSF